MKFSGMDMQGDFRSQIVADVSALVWTSDDERRMIYDQDTEQLWVADSSDWKSMGRYNNIPEGTEMWVYADAPPDGWTLSGTASDTLTAVKGGSTYTTGGVVAGTFSTPAHAHALGHTHIATGAVPAPPNYWICRDSETGSDSSTRNHVHTISLTSGAGTTTTNVDGAASGYRPRARVGIICIR